MMRHPACVALLSALAMLAFSASAAFAQSAWWHVQSGSRPSFLEPDGRGQIVATVTNLGDAATSGQVTIADTLPAGLSAQTIAGEILEGQVGRSLKPVVCSVHPLAERPLVCTVSAGLAAYDAVEIRIGVVVDPGAVQCQQGSPSCEQNVVSVSGGGAPAVSVSRPVTVSEKPVPFGVEAYEVTPEEEGGALTTQAGRHPFQLTGTLTLNQTATTRGGLEGHPVALAKDLASLLPAGLIGNPTPFPDCTVVQLKDSGCPPASVIGIASLTVDEPGILGGLGTFTTPIANMEPARGEAARFGFFAAIVPVYVDLRVRSGGDYGVTFSSSNIPQVAAFLSYKLTFWGVPGAAAHDSARSQACLGEANGIDPPGSCKPFEDVDPPPLLAMPTSCAGPLHTSAEADAWDAPEPEGRRLVLPETEPMPAMHGCSRLPFETADQGHPRRDGREYPDGVDGRCARAAGIDPGRYESRAVRCEGHHARAASGCRAEPLRRGWSGSLL